MGIIAAIILGLLQGIAEFLPVSSSGHLLLFQYFFEIERGGMLFDIILHVATLFAVIVVYRKRLRLLLTWKMVIATAITCIFVLLFKNLIDKTFNIKFLPFAFMLTAVVLILPSLIKKNAASITTNHNNDGKDIPKRKKIPPEYIMGLAQGIAVVPAFSRSGFTITAGQLAGMERTEAADFSFLMSIPIILASLLYEIISGGGFGSIEPLPMIIGFIAAFLSGIFAIKFMLTIIKKIDLRWFSLYLFALSITLFVLFF
ncbi:MAG: undecaprenyl-diphosphate phosphatase [Christensenellaceae bacterium]|nr:undecaprenyl-diphosphate phosphatase [Christensenellaceae bacterium]